MTDIIERIDEAVRRMLVLDADPTEEEHDEAQLAHAEMAAEREGAVVPPPSDDALDFGSVGRWWGDL